MPAAHSRDGEEAARSGSSCRCVSPTATSAPRPGCGSRRSWQHRTGCRDPFARQQGGPPNRCNDAVP